MNWTKEELYVIERDADLNSGIVSKNIHKLCEQLIIQSSLNYKDKEKSDKLGKILMQQIQEQHRSAEMYKKIRDKCEKLRG